jgi:hypothetical protein
MVSNSCGLLRGNPGIVCKSLIDKILSYFDAP